MISKELSYSAVEINEIFNNMNRDILSKIPIKFINFFNEIASKDYSFHYDKNKSLENQVLLPKTKGILALIYRVYLCNEKEKAEYIEYCKKNYIENSKKD